MDWRRYTQKRVEAYCSDVGRRTFTLREFLEAVVPDAQQLFPANRNIEAKIRQQLQFLRDEGLLTFVDNRGTYTLRSDFSLPDERNDLGTLDLSREPPQRREYLVETFVRTAKWSVLARETFGEFCLYRQCANTFVDDGGRRYIEVHHIIPFCEGGEQALWNLSVLCAHHHRMAHFADRQTREEMRRYLEGVNRERLPPS